MKAQLEQPTAGQHIDAVVQRLLDRGVSLPVHPRKPAVKVKP